VQGARILETTIQQQLRGSHFAARENRICHHRDVIKKNRQIVLTLSARRDLKEAEHVTVRHQKMLLLTQ